MRAGRLPLAEALRIAREIGEAIEEAHKNRFLHRDVKSANGMLTPGPLGGNGLWAGAAVPPSSTRCGGE
jgi:hypothetical protein